MDGLKLNQWKENFTAKVHCFQTEYDAFFQFKPLTDFYKLEEDEEGQSLHLEILSVDKLLKEIQERLMQIIEETKPEDSV